MAYSRQTASHSAGDTIVDDHLDVEFDYIYSTILNQGIGTTELTDANVTAAKVATDAIETAKIKNANVTGAKLASDSVTTAKIEDDAVTGAKIAALTIDSIFGSWTNLDSGTDALTHDEIYQVGSDGFVLLYAEAGNAYSFFKAYTDSSSSPTTKRTAVYGSNTWPIGLKFPVKKNDFWTITEGGAAANNVSISWLPIGSGTCTKQ